MKLVIAAVGRLKAGSRAHERLQIGPISRLHVAAARDWLPRLCRIHDCETRAVCAG